ncbi:hypothetical protein FQZ97_1112430 [compost metagenome]
MALAHNRASSGLSIPTLPRTSRVTGRSLATIGRPSCMASTRVLPKPSKCDGSKKTSKLRKKRVMSMPETEPVKWTRSRTPNCSALALTKLSLGPSPANAK